MVKRARCPDCGHILRRLYYQPGKGRRNFEGCTWGCFNCGHMEALRRPKE